MKSQRVNYARTQLSMHESTTISYDIYQLKSRDPTFFIGRHALDLIYSPNKKSVDILAKMLFSDRSNRK